MSSCAFATPERKPSFRFESLATEFETAEENDSGIDSEDVSTVSPGSTASISAISPLISPVGPEQREPLSLVVRKTEESSSPRLPKHWKKSISRNYSGGEEEENQENGKKQKVKARRRRTRRTARS